MLHDADRSLADLHLAEQDNSPQALAAEQFSTTGRSPSGNEQNPGCMAVSADPGHGSSGAHSPPLHLVNARRRLSQGGAGRNVVNVYTRDGAISTWSAQQVLDFMRGSHTC